MAPSHRRTRRRGRPVLGTICGILFGLFLSITLTVYAGIPLDSVLYYVLVAVGLVGGLLLGLTGPFGGRRKAATSPSVPQPPAPPG